MGSGMDEVARVFGLGDVHDAVPVTGGLSNDLWKVVTHRGAFAVKVMRVNAERPDFRSHVEAAFEIEAAAFARGVPCPEPVRLPDGRCLGRVQDRWVRVHHWVDGAAPIATEHATDAAGLMAAIHAGAPTTLAALDDEPWDAAGWASMADQPGMPERLTVMLRDVSPQLADLENRTSDPTTIAVHVASHGDLDPKNTLLVEGGLMALDWDAAGPRSQVREAVSVALDWTTTPDEFRKAIDAYTRVDGAVVPAEHWVFGGWVAAHGGWLVQQATNEAATDAGQHEIEQASRQLLALHSRLDDYLAALD